MGLGTNVAGRGAAAGLPQLQEQSEGTQGTQQESSVVVKRRENTEDIITEQNTFTMTRCGLCFLSLFK